MDERTRETERGDYGEPIELTDVEEVVDAVFRVLGDLVTDHDPRNEDGQRVVLTVSADIERGATGIPEIDQPLREKYLGFDDRPRARWEVEAVFDAVTDLAETLVGSRRRPDTQIVGPSSLEMLVRDETEDSVPLTAGVTATHHSMPTERGPLTATVGSPSPALLLRLALRRSGIERLRVLDRQALFGHLVEQEKRRGIAEGSAARISAQRVLQVAAEPRLLALRLDGPQGMDLDELERAATAFRVRLAYESDIALAPVLDVDRLEGSTQPRLVRQLSLRAAEFTDAIGRGTPTGHIGDRLLGDTHEMDEELSQRYLRAISASDPFAAFMGYYHVLEYSMEEEWFQALRDRVAGVGGVLERPAGHIRKAAKPAATLLGVGTNTVDWSEAKALHAVLHRYLDVRALAADLDRYLSGAADYFANGTVPFTQVSRLDFGQADEAALRVHAADRIYRVRCAITHSKESGDRYSPYTDELFLGREIPLVRIAAEHRLFPPASRL
ncbi:hypothetical protein [Streptomyces sp. NRRL S-646]|uniref:hypothetical protein n=1 Tax=Streptomyces sp. NRRL S-646 TaxID=1463917 RepID=UPI0004CBC954|nr:hypothetical protein [Streptomyces sp. NRRL S-646]